MHRGFPRPVYPHEWKNRCRDLTFPIRATSGRQKRAERLITPWNDPRSTDVDDDQREPSRRQDLSPPYANGYQFCRRACDEQSRTRTSFEYELRQLGSPLFPARLFVRWLARIAAMFARALSPDAQFWSEVRSDLEGWPRSLGTASGLIIDRRDRSFLFFYFPITPGRVVELRPSIRGEFAQRRLLGRGWWVLGDKMAIRAKYLRERFEEVILRTRGFWELVHWLLRIN